MAKHNPVLIHTPVKGVDVEGNELTVKQSVPAQMELFQTFFTSDTESQSNTVELYDVLPLYTASRKIAGMREHGKYLPTLEREFKHRGDLYHLSLSPARIKNKNGEEKEYYPSEREELIEQALRKLCLRQNQGLYLDDMAGVRFYLRELRNELSSMGHDIKYPSLIEGLSVCRRASMRLMKHGKQKSLLDASIFPILMLNSREDWEKSPASAKCYVQFNPLITASIQSLSFRQFNYVTSMHITSMLGRWMYRRISHNYTNASYVHPYTIKASTIVRDSGMNVGTFRKAVQMIESVLEDFKKQRILSGYDKEQSHILTEKNRQKLSDVMYRLYPSMQLKDDIITANKRNQCLTKA